MRASFAVFAAVAAAAPQYSVNPISQISDGQIQAPPATPYYPVYTPSAVSTPVVYKTTVIASSAAPVYSPVKPSSAPAVSSAPVVTYPVVTPPAYTSRVTPIVPSNSTVPAGTAYSPTTPAATPSAVKPSSSAPAQATGAASSNVVGFGGVVLALAAMLA